VKQKGCGFESSEVKYSDFFKTARSYYAEEGLRAFGKGVIPRLGMNIPAVAMSWGTYEIVKSYLIAAQRE